MTESKISFWHPASLISTCFGVGKIPFAPGTFGSLVAIIPVFLLAPFNQNLWLLVILLFSTFVGCYATGFYLKKTGKEDPKEVVVDEVAGILFAYFTSKIAIYYIAKYDIAVSDYVIVYHLYYVILLFLLFRFFDIVKPGPVGWADRNVKGAWGVMLDDIIAGVLAGIFSALIFLAI